MVTTSIPFGDILTLSTISVIKKKPHALTIYSKSVEEVVPFQILPDRNNDLCKHFGREIKKFYFGLTEPSLPTVNAFITVRMYINLTD